MASFETSVHSAERRAASGFIRVVPEAPLPGRGIAAVKLDVPHLGTTGREGLDAIKEERPPGPGVARLKPAPRIALSYSSYLLVGVYDQVSREGASTEIVPTPTTFAGVCCNETAIFAGRVEPGEATKSASKCIRIPERMGRGVVSPR